MTATSLPPKTSVVTPYRRVIITLLVGFLIVGGILIQFTQSYIDQLEKIAEGSPEEALMQATFLVIPLSVVGGIPLVGMGAYFLCFGNQAKTTRRFKSPGTGRVRDTDVIGGQSTQTRGIFIMVLGGLVIVCGLSLPLIFIWLMKSIVLAELTAG